MSTVAHENNPSTFARVVERVDEQKVAADVALTMARPFSSQRVVALFWWQWPVVGDQQHHSLFQPVHVVAARMGQALPVLQEVLGVVRGARQVCPLICG